MEEIKNKAHEDELNKAHEEISDRQFSQRPSEPDNVFWFRCTECGRIFDLRAEGIVHPVYKHCKNCRNYGK